MIAGRFRVERVIGAGGMGAVVAALDTASGQRVAVKMILPEHVDDFEFNARFERESQVAGALRSEHVARVLLASRAADGTPYMVMELLEGTGLEKLLRRGHALGFAEAAAYLIEACDALAEAHANGIVHRDLKPSNLFLADRPGQPPLLKVLDFGISKKTRLDDDHGPHGETPTLTATDSALGSPTYMSPEQLRNPKRVDHRTDIWSLGLILHKMLAGRPAFEADSIGAHLAMIVAEAPTPLRQHRPDAPAELEAIVQRCLQRDLAARFQNVGQLVLALAPFAPASSRPDIDRVLAQVGRAAVEDALPRSEGDPRVPITPPSRPAAPTLSELPTQRAPIAAVEVRSPDPAPRRSVVYLGVVAAVVSGAMLAALVTPRYSRPAARPIESAPAALAPAPSIEPTPSASAPVEVTLQIDVQPRDAALELDGIPVRDNPLRLPKDGVAHRLVARAPGYVDESREVSADENSAVAIALRRAPGEVRRPPPAPPERGGPAKKLKGPMETRL